MGNTLGERIEDLVVEAGGRSLFIDHVWPGCKAGVRRSNEAKLSKWIGGRSGMSVAEAEHVARKFGRRVGNLLFGEKPEMEGVTRSLADLSDDVAAYVAGKVGPRIPLDPREEARSVQHVIPWQIDGAAVLDQAVERTLKAFTDAATVTEEFAKRMTDALDDGTVYRIAIRLGMPNSGFTPEVKRELARFRVELIALYKQGEYARCLRESGAPLKNVPPQPPRTPAKSKASPRTKPKRSTTARKPKGARHAKA